MNVGKFCSHFPFYWLSLTSLILRHSGAVTGPRASNEEILASSENSNFCGSLRNLQHWNLFCNQFKIHCAAIVIWAKDYSSHQSQSAHLLSFMAAAVGGCLAKGVAFWRNTQAFRELVPGIQGRKVGTVVPFEEIGEFGTVDPAGTRKAKLAGMDVSW